MCTIDICVCFVYMCVHIRYNVYIWYNVYIRLYVCRDIAKWHWRTQDFVRQVCWWETVKRWCCSRPSSCCDGGACVCVGCICCCLCAYDGNGSGHSHVHMHTHCVCIGSHPSLTTYFKRGSCCTIASRSSSTCVIPTNRCSHEGGRSRSAMVVMGTFMTTRVRRLVQTCVMDAIAWSSSAVSKVGMCDDGVMM